MNSVSGEATVAATITMGIFNERLKVNIVFLTILRREMRDAFFIRRADVGQLGIYEQPVVKFADSFSE